MCLVSRRWRGHREPESKGRPDATSEKSTIRMSNAAGPKRAKDVVGLGDHRPPSASCAITASGVVDGRRRPQLLTFSPKVCSRHKRIDLVLRPPVPFVAGVVGFPNDGWHRAKPRIRH
jgi:hypothetical protein